MQIIETSLDTDLSSFSRWLWSEHINHRIYEERGRQVLEVLNQVDASFVIEAYERWEDPPTKQLRMSNLIPFKRYIKHLKKYPGLSLLVATSVFFFPLTQSLLQGQITVISNQLLITDLLAFDSDIPSIQQILAKMEVWRWVTPIFIHFGSLHLLFNITVVVYLGRFIERVNGTFVFFVLTILTAISSSLAQYAVTNNPLFGGLSGVGYGFLGFVLIMQKFMGKEVWPVSREFLGSLLLFLVVFSTGVLEFFFDGFKIANAAHWAGLLAGCLISMMLVLVRGFYKRD